MSDARDSQIPSREITRWRARPALLSAVAFFATMLGVLALCGLITGSWTHGQFPSHAANLGPKSDPAWNNAPPQLQTHPATDLAALRAQEYQHLHEVRWTDPTRAYATVPIDESMSLLAQAAAKGQVGQLLPAPKPATPIDLQVQKSTEHAPPVQTPDKP